MKCLCKTWLGPVHKCVTNEAEHPLFRSVANQGTSEKNKIIEKRQLNYDKPQSSNVFLMKKQNLE